MKYAIIGIAALVLALRLAQRRRRRGAATEPAAPLRLGPLTSDVAMISAREVRERLRGRALRIGTLLILLVIAAAIVIPVLDKTTSAPEHVGVVGALTGLQRDLIHQSAVALGVDYRLVAEPGVEVALARLRSGALDVVVTDATQLHVATPVSPSDTSSSTLFIESIAKNLGVAEAIDRSGITPAQASTLLSARSLPVLALTHGASKSPEHTVSVFGLVIVFVMLTQYNTWILMGVMDEKSSRVVEVLLAAVRPMQLLAGKVLGIGLVAFAQASIILSFALVLGHLVGSSFLKGSAPTTLAATLLWLVLGYVFYSWVYAAAGSTVERQEQVQSLAFPLSLPILFAYIMSITTVAEGSASTLFQVLAYLPPTAPFAMPVLVGFGEVTWWEFTASVALSLLATYLVARVAATIYRRAILRTGRRVKIRELFAAR